MRVWVYLRGGAEGEGIWRAQGKVWGPILGSMPSSFHHLHSDPNPQRPRRPGPGKTSSTIAGGGPRAALLEIHNPLETITKS